MRSIQVRVFNSDGRPVSGARVGCWVYQTGASGSLPYQYTNTDGEVEINTDADEYAELAISIDGVEKVSRGKIRGSYRINL